MLFRYVNIGAITLQLRTYMRKTAFRYVNPVITKELGLYFPPLLSLAYNSPVPKTPLKSKSANIPNTRLKKTVARISPLNYSRNRVGYMLFRNSYSL